MAAHNELGQAGETAATQYLLERDYHILERNWRAHPHEVDIIADDFGEIVFVEVKTRRTDRWESPEAAVDRYKRYNLSRAALTYLRQRRMGNVPFRFDIITLVGEAPPFEIQHFKNAFPLIHPNSHLHHDQQHRFL